MLAPTKMAVLPCAAMIKLPPMLMLLK